MKVVVKLALVFSDEKMMDEHEYALDDLQNKFRALLLTLHSFDQVCCEPCQPDRIDELNYLDQVFLLTILFGEPD